MRGLYVHIPFCASKCTYCDFYSLPGLADSLGSYVKAVLIEAYKYKGLDFQTLYLGGGTPSLLKPAVLRQLLKGLRGILDLSNLREATIEANPDSVSSLFLEAAWRAGLNRISIGVQSLSNVELKKVRRLHNSTQSIEAIRLARQAGFQNISCDVIAGLPGQNFSSLADTLSRLADEGIQHLSLYCLSVEPHTPLGLNPHPDLPTEDEQAALYEKARSWLEKRGMVHYEISNFSLRGYECQHNLNYWRGGEYVGLGPAASSHLQGRRFTNKADLNSYLPDPGGQVENVEFLPMREKAAEEAIVRLRLLKDGLNTEELAARFGSENIERLKMRLDKLTDKGLLTRKGPVYRLPRARVLVSNQILTGVLNE